MGARRTAPNVVNTPTGTRPTREDERERMPIADDPVTRPSFFRSPAQERSASRIPMFTPEFKERMREREEFKERRRRERDIQGDSFRESPRRRRRREVRKDFFGRPIRRPRPPFPTGGPRGPFGGPRDPRPPRGPIDPRDPRTPFGADPTRFPPRPPRGPRGEIPAPPPPRPRPGERPDGTRPELSGLFGGTRPKPGDRIHSDPIRRPRPISRRNRRMAGGSFGDFFDRIGMKTPVRREQNIAQTDI